MRRARSFPPAEHHLRRGDAIYCEQIGEPANPIPLLCHREHMTPVAACRVCVVEQAKFHRLVPACYRSHRAGHGHQNHPHERKSEAHGEDDRRDADDRSRSTARSRVGSTAKTSWKPWPSDWTSRPAACRAVERPWPGRFVAGHRRRPQRLHPLRPLHPRLQRDPQQPGHRPHGQGLQGADRLRPERPDGRVSPASLRRVHGVLPDRGARQPQRRRREAVARRPRRRRSRCRPKSCQPSARSRASRTPFLRWNEGSVVRRHFKKARSSAARASSARRRFLIEKGEVEVFIQHAAQARQSRQGQRRRSSRLVRAALSADLVTAPSDQRDEEGSGAFHPHRRPGVACSTTSRSPSSTHERHHLRRDDLHEQLSALGDGACAAERRTVLEMLRNVLYILQRNKKSRALLDDVYRDRAIDSHLRSVPVCSPTCSQGRGRVPALRRFPAAARRAGAAQPRRGDLPPGRHGRQLLPGPHRLREGVAAPARRRARAELHRPRRLLRRDRPAVATCPELRDLAPPGVRTATCSALDHVDVVRSRGDDFQQLLDRRSRPFASSFVARRQRAPGGERSKRASRSRRVPLGEFLSQGLMNAQSLLVLDLEKCTRCDECTKACADAHDGVTRLIREGLRFDKFLVASSCRSCLDPYCMVGCPVGSIRRRKSREIIIEDWCIGCGKCAENCPYGNINMHASSPTRRRADPATGRRAIGRAAEGDDVRPVPRARRPAELRLRLPARRRPPHDGTRTIGNCPRSKPLESHRRLNHSDGTFDSCSTVLWKLCPHRGVSRVLRMAFWANYDKGILSGLRKVDGACRFYAIVDAMLDGDSLGADDSRRPRAVRDFRSGCCAERSKAHD